MYEDACCIKKDVIATQCSSTHWLIMGLQVKELRSEISRLLHQKVTDPAFDLSKSKAIDALHQLLATDGF